ncbi:MAG: PQQ-binding-like beta-propeller repeat protein [Dehalococcoidia bacterium]|nr:PQQ-binding-like beta-propeller repeat protein [Dehalococcoidia bacterium]
MKHARQRRGALIALAAVFALVAVGCGGVQRPDGWAAPVQVGDGVLVQARSGQLSLINPANGQPAWQYPSDDDGGRPFYATPVVEGDSVYVADYKGRVARLDANVGNATWATDLDVQVVATPLLRNGSLFVPAEDGTIAVLDVSSGAVTRTIDTTDRRIWSSPAADGGGLYVSDLDNGITIAFNPSTGERLWEQSATGASAADLVLDGDLLMVGSFDRSLHSLGVEQGGQERWVAQGDGWFLARPLVSGRTVFASTMHGTVYALDRATGAERWTFTADDGAEFRAAPVIVGGHLVVAARDGRVFALDTTDGSLRWTVETAVDGNLNADPLVVGSDIYYSTSKHNLVRVDADNEGAPQAIPLAAAR